MVRSAESPTKAGQRWTGSVAQARAPLLSTLLILGVIWLVVPLLPEGWGWRFGTPFKLFFSAITVGAGLFFLLLKSGPLRLNLGSGAVLGSIVLVYLGTVAILVGVGTLVPQFQRPKTAQEEAASQIERGRAVFLDPGVGCYLCHAIGGGAATRGPDLAGVAEKAETRKPGMGTEEYLRESITNPGAFLVPTYAPIMPTDFAQRLSQEQIDDLLAYMLSLK